MLIVTSQQEPVSRYNKIVQQQCTIHRIHGCSQQDDKILQIFESKMAQEDDANNLCTIYHRLGNMREEVAQDTDTTRQFSPMIQMWYDRVLVSMQLVRLKEEKSTTARNIF